jgi:multidrug resistance protein MdtO
MERTFVSTLRFLGRLMRAPISSNLGVAIEEVDSLRETINTNFDRLREQGDGVMLEFGSTRERKLSMRSQLLDWQIQLRVFFVVRNALLKYRLRLPGFEAPEPVLRAQQEFDTQLAEQLDGMADRLSGKDVANQRSLEPRVLPLEKSIQENCPTELPDCLPAMRSLLPLCRQIESILSSLDHEMFST